jgi:uncharacterized membrane protein
MIYIDREMLEFLLAFFWTKICKNNNNNNNNNKQILKKKIDKKKKNSVGHRFVSKACIFCLQKNITSYKIF